jgi:hypothetical protein
MAAAMACSFNRFRSLSGSWTSAISRSMTRGVRPAVDIGEDHVSQGQPGLVALASRATFDV